MLELATAHQKPCDVAISLEHGETTDEMIVLKAKLAEQPFDLNAALDVSPEIPDVSPEVSEDAGPDNAVPDDAAPDNAASDDAVPPDVTPNAAPGVAPEVSSEVASIASANVSSDVVPIDTPDLSPDAKPEISPEVSSDVVPGASNVAPDVSADDIADELIATSLRRRLVETKMLAVARRLAAEGTGENTPAHGFCFIGGDGAKLMETDADGDGVVGKIGKPQFDYRHFDYTLDKPFDAIQALAKEDGAIVFDLHTGALLGGNYRVGNIVKGDDRGGGMRHQAASAIAQQAGGCFVIKVSEDSCGCQNTPLRPDAKLCVFNHCKIARLVPCVLDETLFKAYGECDMVIIAASSTYGKKTISRSSTCVSLCF